MVAPVNNWLDALWLKIDVTLNGTSLCSSSHHYPFRAYIETLANYGSDKKSGQLTTSLWYKDQAGTFDTIADAANTGYAARKALIAHSQKVSMMG